MGESVVENLDPRLGSTIWADWTNQASNRPLIVGQFQQLLPVQEMLPFQRVIRTRGFSQGFIVNQRVRFDANVPDDEAWRIIAIGILHDNAADMQWVVRVTQRGQPFLYRAANVLVVPNEQTPLYPSASVGAEDDEARALTGPPLEAFPGDQFTVRSPTLGGAAGGVVDFSIRYELIPLPLRKERDEAFVGSSAV